MKFTALKLSSGRFAICAVSSYKKSEYLQTIIIIISISISINISSI
jgi:hypothetical protein